MVSPKYREEFVSRVNELVTYWYEKDGENTYDKLHGLAYSILAVLDGEAYRASSINLPKFSVRAIEGNQVFGDNISGDLSTVFAIMTRERLYKSRAIAD
jgi:hypothetical protein